MKAYLVITNPKSLELTYKEIYRVFLNRKEAIAHAEKGGYKNDWGFNDTIGVKNWYAGGAIDISIIPVEVEGAWKPGDKTSFTAKEINDASIVDL